MNTEEQNKDLRNHVFMERMNKDRFSTVSFSKIFENSLQRAAVNFLSVWSVIGIQTLYRRLTDSKAMKKSRQE